MYRILINALAIFLLLLVIATISAVAIKVIVNQEREREVRKLFKTVKPYPQCCIEEDEIEDFPLVFQRYFSYIQLVGSDVVYSVRMKQKGFVVKPDGKDTIHFASEQYYRGDTPSYLWISDRGATTIQDSYINGKAVSQTKFLNFFQLDMKRGKEMNQAALLNYFSEMFWFPSAYLQNGILWDATGENSFKGILERDGIEVTAHFEIDEQGALKRFTVNSCVEVKGIGIPLKCSVEVSDYREFGGYKIPYKVKSILTLNQEDHEFMNLELQEIEYNTEIPFSTQFKRNK